jgi:hypothetical protein
MVAQCTFQDEVAECPYRTVRGNCQNKRSQNCQRAGGSLKVEVCGLSDVEMEVDDNICSITKHHKAL